MPTSLPVPTKAAGDLLTSSLWNSYLRDNINKLLQRQHRVLTTAQFTALTGLEGTKGTVPPDEAYVEVDATNGIMWHVVYESGEATYKWRFVGGPPIRATGNGTLTLPRAGDYAVIAVGHLAASTGGDNSAVVNVIPSSGSTAGRNTMQLLITVPSGTYTIEAENMVAFTALSVSASATLPWSGDTSLLTAGSILATPIRIN